MTAKTKYLVVAGLVCGLLLLAATVAIQLRSSYTAQQQAQVRKAPPPTLLTTITPAASIPALRAAATRTPRDPAAWSRLGDGLLAASDLPAATDAYKRAVALDETRWQDWSALGEVYVQSAQADGARLPAAAHDAFDHVRRLHPTDMRTQFYLAMERDFTGGHDAAIDAWMTMLARVPAGSRADDAIRGAIIASVARHAITVRERMLAATNARKGLKLAAR